MKKIKYFYPYVIRGLIVYFILNAPFIIDFLAEDSTTGVKVADEDPVFAYFIYWNFFLFLLILFKQRRIIFANFYNNKFEWVSEEKLSASEMIKSFDSTNRGIIHNRLYDKTKNIQEAYLVNKQSENHLIVEIDTFSLLKGKKEIYPKKQVVGYQKEYNTILFPIISQTSVGNEGGIPSTSTDVAVVFFENGWDRYEQPNLLNRVFDSELCELVMRTEHQIQKFISLPAKISYVENNSKGEYVFELKLSRDELIKELTKIKDNPELRYK
jgi:hypothetical protein